MKKTVYFASDNRSTQLLKAAIKDATDQRDAFISENSSSIASIDSEKLKTVSSGSDNNMVSIIIQLSYTTL
jgi:hypothetical protein